MKIQKTVVSVGVACAGLCCCAASGTRSELTGNVRLKGYLGKRLDAMIERHVAGNDVSYITDCFREKTERKGWWQTEFWGKYMHSAVPYLIYSGSDKLRGNVERGLESVLSSQEPCGYIGNYPDDVRCGEGWDVWGMKYTMMGLMHYYDGSRSRAKAEVERGDRALTACRRLCDYVIGELGPNGRRGHELWTTGNWSGLASSSILEPVVWLYNRTDDRKYLDFASYIVKGMCEPEAGPRLVDLALKGVAVADRNGFGNKPDKRGEYVMKHNRWKAYEMMSCYQGLLEYVEAKSRADGSSKELDRLRLAAVLTGEDIAKNEVDLAGGCSCSEAWFKGASKQHLAYERQHETCVTTTWMRFCEKLHAVTGETKWLDQIEKSFYNVYLGALCRDGSTFEAYTPMSGSRWNGMDHCFMHTDCCTANGPRGFLCFLREFFWADDRGARFNFYATALAKAVNAKGQEIAFDMYSRYPRANFVRIVSHTENVGTFPLRLRVPSWCGKALVKLNGKVQPGGAADGYFTLSHEWKLGDVVEVEFGMPVVAHVQDSFVAYTRGPVLLARDSRFNDGDLMEPLPYGSVRDGEVMSGFSPVVVPSDDMWMAFSGSLPLGQHKENPEGQNPSTVFFCDFASAGNLWQRGNYYRTWFPIERLPVD